MAVTTEKRLRVAVVGAGLGGLFLVLFLQKYCPDIQVDVYESTAELTEVGAGIGIMPRMWELLRQLDIPEEELYTVVGSPDGPALSMSYGKGDQPKIVSIGSLVSAVRPCHRAQFQMLLAKHVRDASTLHFSKRLASYEEPASPDEPIVLKFRDGSEATCDLLVGSDGIRSAVRRTMYTALAAEEKDETRAAELLKIIDPIWSGIIVYRGLVPIESIAEENISAETLGGVVLTGRDRNMVIYPIAQGKFINTAAFINLKHTEENPVFEGKWVAEATPEDVVKEFETWDPEIPRLIKHMERPLLWAIHKTRHLPTYVKGRVALVGDAAHAMVPFQASGAGQATEDGFILGQLLAQPTVTRHTLARALTVYDAVRRPFAQEIQRLSDENGRIYHLRRLGWEELSAEQSTAGEYAPEMLGRMQDALMDAVQWTLKGSAMGERDKALKMLEEVLAAN